MYSKSKVLLAVASRNPFTTAIHSNFKYFAPKKRRCGVLILQNAASLTDLKLKLSLPPRPTPSTSSAEKNIVSAVCTICLLLYDKNIELSIACAVRLTGLQS